MVIRDNIKSTLKVTILHASGLHAYPAALFVQTAKKFTSDVKVQNLTRGSSLVNAKSILSVMTLGVTQNHEIQIDAEGEDTEEAISALEALIQANFGE